MRLDGFVGLSAGDEKGTLTTKPFRLDGGNLELNVDASAGSVRVECLDEQGRPLPGYAGEQAVRFENMDNVRFRPTWNNGADLTPLVGRNIRLKIELQNAQLFAFQIQK